MECDVKKLNVNEYLQGLYEKFLDKNKKVDLNETIKTIKSIKIGGDKIDLPDNHEMINNVIALVYISNNTHRRYDKELLLALKEELKGLVHTAGIPLDNNLQRREELQSLTELMLKQLKDDIKPLLRRALNTLEAKDDEECRKALETQDEAVDNLIKMTETYNLKLKNC